MSALAWALIGVLWLVTVGVALVVGASLGVAVCDGGEECPE